MEYKEDDFLMISGIQHFKFCRRQWALIHIEQQWAENVHTVTGELMHKKAHDASLTEKRKGVLITRALPIVSRELGASGVCDVVEFHNCAEANEEQTLEKQTGENEFSDSGVSLYGHRGRYRIYPVEYKKGKPKISEEDILQLTAQAMCLEEMFSAQVTEGAIYYGETRKRQNVVFTETLREQVRTMFQEMHQYYSRQYTPKVRWHKGCSSCSLKEICMPKLGKTDSVKSYLEQVWKEGTE